MLVIKDEELKYFDWNDEAQKNAWELHDDDWERLEYELDKRYPQGIGFYELQWLVGKHFDKVCAWLGLEWDAKNGRIVRGDD